MTKAEETFSSEKLEFRTFTLRETNPAEESATAEAVSKLVVDEDIAIWPRNQDIAIS